MSPSFMKKTMVYLGLLDDEYDEYDDLEDRAPRGFSAATRVEPRSQDQDQEPAEAFSGGMSRVRTIPRESAQPREQTRSTPSNVSPRPTAVRAVPVDPTMNPTGPAPAPSGRVHVVAPSRFGDAKEIADRLKDNRPVIVNLQMADRDLQRQNDRFLQRGHLRPEWRDGKGGRSGLPAGPYQREGLRRGTAATG